MTKSFIESFTENARIVLRGGIEEYLHPKSEYELRLRKKAKETRSEIERLRIVLSEIETKLQEL